MAQKREINNKFKKRTCTIFWFSVLLMSAFFSCEESPEARYRRLEQTELASGVRYDSLFKGLYLSMKEQDFYDYCFQMNLQKEFWQAGIKKSTWVESKLEDELTYPAAINFFPKFREKAIAEMEAAIYYDNASFEEHTFNSDSLLLDVLHLMEKWYGTGFIKIPSPYFYKEDVFVKVDGNRRITVSKDISGRMINIWYVDLLAKNEKEDERD